ncbi:MAG: site-2 protease family protein [Candidatus Diapherotrites archaeon]|nr:site-2 protease family protein [Candidatus Diapherotrites archaeon]
MVKKSFHAHSRQKIPAAKKKVKPFVLNKKKGFLFAGILILTALIEFFLSGVTPWFWLFIVLGALVLLPNVILSFFKFSRPYLIPYFITMVKTKRFVQTIKNISHFGKIWEKFCIFGIFVGFGLAGIDYWKARKLPKRKRIFVLLLSSVLLCVFLYVCLALLMPAIFTVSFFKPLIIPLFIGFILLGFGGFSFAILLGYGALSVNSIFTNIQICPNVAPVLPGVPIPGLGVVIPLVGWISLGIILVVHETSHGMILAFYMKKIKSVGLLLAGIFPIGAFVEESEKSFNKLPDRKKLLVLSAGSTINLVTIPVALILLFIFSLLFSAPIESQMNLLYNGLKVDSVDQNVSFCGVTKPGASYGKLLAEDKVISIDGKKIEKMSDVNAQILNNKNISFVVLRDGNTIDVNVTPVEFESLGVKKIGVQFSLIKAEKEAPVWFYPALWLDNSIFWILLLLWVLSFAIGTFNYIPVDPFDGGKMAKIILLPYFSFLGMPKDDTGRFIGRLFLWLFIGSLLLNLIPYFTMII